MRREIRLYAAVAAASALGAVCRYLCGLAVLAVAGPGFPWGTLAVNVLGSFGIGLFATLSGPDGRWLLGPTRRLAVMTGFCGGFTTFSAFGLETVLALEQADYALAGLNLGVSIVGWLVAAWIGLAIATRINRLKGT